MSKCPKGFFCIKTINISILVIIILILIIILIGSGKISFNNENHSDIQEPQIVEKIVVVKEECQERNTPPEQKNIYSDQPHGMPININTRGTVDYQQIGILSKAGVSNSQQLVGNSSDVFIIPLYGRPVYKGSNRYNYYTMTGNNIKIPLTINNELSTDDRGCDEIRDGDTINIPEFNGLFTCKIYGLDKPKYIPFI